MADIINALLLVGNFLIVPALAYGCQIALGALGVTLVFAILRFSNLAHGELMSMGAFFTIILTWLMQSLGIGLGSLPTALMVLPLAIIGNIIVALSLDRCVYRFYRQKKTNPVILLIVSVGVMYFMAGLIRFLIGTDEQTFSDGARFLLRARDVKASLNLDEGLTIKTSHALTFVITLISTVSLFYILNRTKIGKMMRAYADNESLALLSGINPERIVMITWVITATLAALAGALYGLDKGYKPFVYQQLLLPVFAAAILGGLGSPIGALVGGFVVAFSEICLTYAYIKLYRYIMPEAWWPNDGLLQLIPTDYKFAISFVILVIILIIRPTGLFGKAGQ